MAQENEPKNKDGYKPSAPVNCSTEGVWWCTSHKREATYVDEHGKHHCDPKLGGILLPCFVIFKPIEIIP